MSPFRGTNGIAFGPDGRLHVAEYLSGRISAVDLATGEIEVIVPIDSVVQSPDDLAFGADGSMYVADLVPGRVWRRAPLGEYTLVSDEVKAPNGITCVGDRLFVNEMRPGGRLFELFPDGGEPVVLATDLAIGNAMQAGPDGHLYYPHMLTGEVHRISPDGGTPELVADGLHSPVAVRFDREGALLILTTGAEGEITRISPTGRRHVLTTGVFGLDNAAVDDDNRLYVSSFASGGIAEVYPDGRIRQIVPQGLVGPYGVAVDSGGVVHAADHYRVAGDQTVAFTHGVAADQDRLHTTSQYGEVRTDGKVRTKGLRCPLGIAVRDDVLVIAETGAGRIIAIDADDTVTVVADGFHEPVDVAFDAEQRCYVSDEQGVHRVEDGRPVPIAEGLVAPQGLAVRDDELFVVEAGRHRLLAVDLTTGAIRTEAENLALGPLETVPRALVVHGMPGCPRGFAGLAVAPDGTLHVSGDGAVLRIP
ncbi:Sugar lactone lactonase YvrE [Lentzea waywayandensis]|uniref:Sugar lactone lactonase YvrE n=1 Tax=Lentzea waywayandensis TaxID=84724 RepID=A0A1I6FDB3_9PSEU|nr:SMP-30/gluconolactonase/LRE family protein [Lentzea waywayandensis]SFR27976.1 Sugar lactone lactonase YvrE [Lentzea waywayandensis]